MKTVMIYDQLDSYLRFVVLDGDYRHLDGVYINALVDATKKEQQAMEKKQHELNDLIYDDKAGNVKVKMLGKFPTEEVVNGAAVIAAGFIP